MKRKPHNPTPAEFCVQHRACSAGASFAMQYQTMADVWDNCKRPEWLLWILGHLDITLDKDRRLFACWCAVCTPMANGKTTRSLLTDPRSLEAVRVAARHALGRASDAELDAARAAASNAARAAASNAARASNAAIYAAIYAARAAASAAASNAASNAAWDAASAAAWDAASAAASARDAASAAQCVQLRTLVPNPFQ